MSEFARLRVPKRKEEYLASRAALKDLVVSCSPQAKNIQRNEIQVFKEPSGVPYMTVFGTHRLPGWISLSHSNGQIFSAFSPDDIRFGVDIERIEPRADEFIADFFTPSEQQYLLSLNAADKPLYATLAWSVKESVLKTVETGLGIDTRSLEIHFPLDLHVIDGWSRVDLSGSMRKVPGFRIVWHRSGDFVLTICAPVYETLKKSSLIS